MSYMQFTKRNCSFQVIFVRICNLSTLNDLVTAFKLLNSLNLHQNHTKNVHFIDWNGAQ